MESEEKNEEEVTEHVESPTQDVPEPPAPPPAPPVPPAAETKPAPQDIKRENVMVFNYSDLMTIPIGPDGKEIVVQMQTIDANTKKVLETQRSLLHGYRPTAVEVRLHHKRTL